MPETQIAVTEKTVGQYVQEVLPALIKSYAVRAYDGNAWMKTAALAIVENPDLMACLQTEAGRISLKHALRFAATTGLSLNPQEGKAALVPIKGKVYYWPMKNGLVDLVLDTGAVKYVRMNAVRQQDRFVITETMDGDSYEFSPNMKTRGEIIGFFCAIKLKDGGSLVEYMTREEVNAHRDAYSKRTGPDSAWGASFEGMGIKTVVKRAIKRLALPPEAEKTMDAALADGEAVEATFTAEPAPAKPEKGTSAADVEGKLKEKQDAQKPPEEQIPQKFAEGAPGPIAASQPASAGATASSAAAGAQGSASSTAKGAEQPELGLPGGKSKDIF